MKDYFINLFNYNFFANTKIAEVITAAEPSEKPVQLMSHLLTAEQVWLRRLNGEYKIEVVLWPDWTAADLAPVIEKNNELWLDYLNNTTDTDVANSITYQNFAGIEYTMKVVDIITHVINHGTHTRAQAGVYLRQAGVEKLPITDFSFYMISR